MAWGRRGVRGKGGSRVLEAAPGSATCDGRWFQDPEQISLSPWHNGWTEGSGETGQREDRGEIKAAM